MCRKLDEQCAGNMWENLTEAMILAKRRYKFNYFLQSKFQLGYKSKYLLDRIQNLINIQFLANFDF